MPLEAKTANLYRQSNKEKKTTKTENSRALGRSPPNYSGFMKRNYQKTGEKRSESIRKNNPWSIHRTRVNVCSPQKECFHQTIVFLYFMRHLVG